VGLYPSPDQYNDAVQNPRLAFFNPALKVGQVKRNALGLPLALGGTFALTYTITTGGKKYAVRCFHKEIRDLAARYVSIARGLRAVGGPYFVDFEFRPQGVLVGGEWFPTVEMDWADGSTLGVYVEAIYSDAQALRALRDRFKELERFLREKGIAHGDIQNGNVLFGMGLTLVDYDGVFVPGLKLGEGTELGHRNFQHPKRGPADFGPLLDRFSFILVDLSLRAMRESPALFRRYYDGENLIFSGSDLAAPSTSPLFKELLGIVSLRRDVENFAKVCLADTRSIPTLDEFLLGQNIPNVSVSLGHTKKAQPAPAAPPAFKTTQSPAPFPFTQSISGPAAVSHLPPLPGPSHSVPAAPTSPPPPPPPKPVPVGAIIGWGVALLILLNVVSCVSGFIRDISRPSPSSQSRPEPYTRQEPYSPPYYANPSFPCSGDLSWQQRAICSDEALAAQDRELAEVSERVSGYADPEQLRRIDDRWREEWDRCGGSGDIPACLGWVYREWLEVLRELRPMAQPDRGAKVAAPNPEPTPEVPGKEPTIEGPATVPERDEVRRPRPAERAEPRTREYVQPASGVTCVLPSGQEMRLSYDECRARAGVVYE
jgi:hypothetical protein